MHIVRIYNVHVLTRTNTYTHMYIHNVGRHVYYIGMHALVKHTCTHTCMVYLHTPSVFHSLMEWSLDPDTICLLSAENATLITSFVCPTNLLVVVPLEKVIQHTCCLVLYM